MFELIVRDRCTGCNRCVEVCPTNVLEPGPDRVPVGARVEHCQTCFMCELYCKEDAIYVGPDREQPEPVNEAELVASGLLGQYRRDSGWDEWSSDPRYDNQIWKLDLTFRPARSARSNACNDALPSGHKPLSRRLRPAKHAPKRAREPGQPNRNAQRRGA